MRRVVAALLMLPLLAFAACSGDDDDAAAPTQSSKPTLTVSAAASLKKAFEGCADRFDAAKVRFSFAGSDELAAQIEHGATPDVYAAANTKLPEQLASDGKLEEPVVFAGNRLVIAVPGGSKVARIEDLEKPGMKLVIGDKDVPVGSYARDVLGRLPRDESEAILDNVRSEEPDVAGIVGKLTQGAADAGFTYITDVVGTGGKLDSVELPDDLQPSVKYGIGIVKGAKEPAAGKALIDSLTHGPCREAMQDAGFEPAPAG